MSAAVLVAVAGLTILLAIAIPLIILCIKSSKRDQRTYQTVAQLALTQNGIHITDAAEFARSGTPLPPHLPGLWFNVISGDFHAFLGSFESTLIILYRNWQVMVIQQYEDLLYQDGKQIRKGTARFLQSQSSQARRKYKLSWRRQYSTKVLVLLPTQVPSTDISPGANLGTDPNATTLGIEHVATRQPAFKERSTVFSRDPEFVLKGMRRPVFDYLVDSWEQRQRARLVFGREIATGPGDGGRLNPAVFMPLIDHLINVLERMDTQSLATRLA